MDWFHNNDSDFPHEAWLSSWDDSDLIGNHSNPSRFPPITANLREHLREYNKRDNFPMSFLTTIGVEWLINCTVGEWEFDDNMGMVAFKDKIDVAAFKLAWQNGS